MSSLQLTFSSIYGLKRIGKKKPSPYPLGEGLRNYFDITEKNQMESLSSV